MDKLQSAREIINAVDCEMARLFETRMEAAKAVAMHKIEHNLPIDDLGREAEIIERNSGYIADETYKPYYVEFLKNNIRLSKELQHKLMEDTSSVCENNI
ncbi:MAG: chorismate mutase [Peptococcaceae bacterium]|nr:chorismate mutase [Peptococcaceae bacterium]